MSRTIFPYQGIVECAHQDEGLSGRYVSYRLLVNRKSVAAAELRRQQASKTLVSVPCLGRHDDGHAVIQSEWRPGNLHLTRFRKNLHRGRAAETKECQPQREEDYLTHDRKSHCHNCAHHGSCDIHLSSERIATRPPF